MSKQGKNLKFTGGRSMFPAVAGLAAPVGLFVLGGWIFSWLVPDVSGRVMGRVDGDRGALVVIDAGHGGEDGGTQGNELLEKNCTLDVARRVARSLRALGHRVALTRDGDRGLSLTERSLFANERRAACFVSIHFNNASQPEVEGIETYYSLRKDRADRPLIQNPVLHRGVATPAQTVSRRLAECVQRGAIGQARSFDRGVHERSELVVMRRTSCPAVLIEGGFLSNKSDARRLRSEEWRNRLARGIADGINAFLKSRPRDGG